MSVEVSNDGETWNTVDGGARVPWTLAGGDGVKTVFARWRDVYGSLSDAVTATVLLDRVAPAVSTPTRPAMVVPQTTGSSSVSVRFSWEWSDDRSGVLWYEVERSVNGGSWSPVGLPETSSMTTAATFDASVRYRVRTVDAARNVSAWAYAATIRPTRVQQTSTALSCVEPGSPTTRRRSSVGRPAVVAGRVVRVVPLHRSLDRVGRSQVL